MRRNPTSGGEYIQCGHDGDMLQRFENKNYVQNLARVDKTESNVVAMRQQEPSRSKIQRHEFNFTAKPINRRHSEVIHAAAEWVAATSFALADTRSLIRVDSRCHDCWEVAIFPSYIHQLGLACSREGRTKCR